jgi:hypothetical protein
LEQISYEAERGDFGLVAAKVVAAPSNAPHIVINWPAFADASLDLVERTLAHEGGHVAIHARGESQNWDSIAASLPAPQNSVRWAALCALEEFRVERQVGAAGYPIAGRAEKESLDDQLFELSYTVLGALTNTGISNFDLADTILKAQFRFSAVLGYLAGAMIGGRTIFEPSMLSSFEASVLGRRRGRDLGATAQAVSGCPAVGHSVAGRN